MNKILSKLLSKFCISCQYKIINKPINNIIVKKIKLILLEIKTFFYYDHDFFIIKRSKN